MPSSKTKKSFFKVVIAIVFIVVLTIVGLWLCLPSLLKDYVQTHDKEWFDREVSIEKIKINPFQCKVIIYNAIVNETNNTSQFLSFDKLQVNFNFWDLVQNKIGTDEIRLDNLVGNIIQNGTHFNFSDLFKVDNSKKNEASEPLDFVLRKMKVSNATINYIDAQINSKVILDSISIEDEVFTNKDSVFNAKVSIHQPDGGWVNGKVSYNLNNDNYAIETQIKSLKLSPFKSYVTSVIRLSEFKGIVNADLHILGNTATDYIRSNGKVIVSDFDLIDPENKPLINVGEFLIEINEIDSKENIYDFKEILFKDSNIVFEYLPNGDNFTKLLVDFGNGAEQNNKTDHYVSPFEMLSVYIYDMTKEYIFKSYTAKNIALSNFNLKFYDYTLEDPFHMDLEHLNIKAQDIKPENQYANFNIDGGINATGIIKGDVSVSRSGVENMKVNMDINGLFLNRFSPYGRFYTAHRFLEGISSFKNESVIKDSYLTSTNKINIQQIKVSKKDKTQNGSSLPMRLAVALMKNSEGNIDIEIPIEGPVNDPEYKFGKIVWQVIKNIFVKAVSSPVKVLSKLVKTDVDNLRNIYFDNGQPGAGPKQRKLLDKMAIILSKKEELNIKLTHLYNKDYEIDAIGLNMAKLEYLQQANLDLDKSVPLGKHAFDLAATDDKFITFLKMETPNFDETISVPENARRLVGYEVASQKLSEAIKGQKEQTKAYLIEKGISADRIIIEDKSDSPEAINQSLPKFEVDFGVQD